MKLKTFGLALVATAFMAGSSLAAMQPIPNPPEKPKHHKHHHHAKVDADAKADKAEAKADAKADKTETKAAPKPTTPPKK